MMRIIAILLVIGFIIATPINHAAANEKPNIVVIKVDGLSCPFCIYGLEKQLNKIDGVESTSVDIKAGEATITTIKDVSDDNLREAVKKAGFTPRKISRP